MMNFVHSTPRLHTKLGLFGSVSSRSIVSTVSHFYLAWTIRKCIARRTTLTLRLTHFSPPLSPCNSTTDTASDGKSIARRTTLTLRLSHFSSPLSPCNNTTDTASVGKSIARRTTLTLCLSHFSPPLSPCNNTTDTAPSASCHPHEQLPFAPTSLLDPSLVL